MHGGDAAADATTNTHIHHSTDEMLQQTLHLILHGRVVVLKSHVVTVEADATTNSQTSVAREARRD